MTIGERFRLWPGRLLFIQHSPPRHDALAGLTKNPPSPPLIRRRRGRAQAHLSAGNDNPNSAGSAAHRRHFNHAPPQWWAVNHSPACCNRLCKSVPPLMLAIHRLCVTKDGSLTSRLAFAALPHRTSDRSPCRRTLVFRCGWDVALAHVSAGTGEAVTRGC